MSSHPSSTGLAINRVFVVVCGGLALRVERLWSVPASRKLCSWRCVSRAGWAPRVWWTLRDDWRPGLWTWTRLRTPWSGPQPDWAATSFRLPGNKHGMWSSKVTSAFRHFHLKYFTFKHFREDKYDPNTFQSESLVKRWSWSVIRSQVFYLYKSRPAHRFMRPQSDLRTKTKAQFSV